MLSPLRTKRPNRLHAKRPPVKNQHVHIESGVLVSTNGSPADTSRRRAAARVAGLTSTPPRASHADKVQHIFHDLGRTYIIRECSTTTSSSSNGEASNDDVEPKRLHGVDDLTKPHPFLRFGQPLEDSTASAVPDFLLPSPPPRTLVRADDTSTDSWTGDDEFFPRSPVHASSAGRHYEHASSTEHKVREKRDFPKALSPTQQHTSAPGRKTRTVLEGELTGVSPRRGSRFRVIERQCTEGVPESECEQRLTTPLRNMLLEVQPSRQEGEALGHDQSSDADDEEEEGSDGWDC